MKVGNGNINHGHHNLNGKNNEMRLKDTKFFTETKFLNSKLTDRERDDLD